MLGKKFEEFEKKLAAFMRECDLGGFNGKLFIHCNDGKAEVFEAHMKVRFDELVK